MMRILKTALLAGCVLTTAAAVQAEELSYSGQLRGLLSVAAGNGDSPVRLAAQAMPASDDTGAGSGALESEWQIRAANWSATATLQGQANGQRATRAAAWLNELYANASAGNWQFSAGKKIVAWDVGYGFRPNDVVQQEKRRALISNTPVGRPLAMAEYFDATLAAALVWVNPLQGASDEAAQEVAQERALAARAYYRAGGVDLHGFARYGRDSGTSLGAAAAWVVGDALELHASVRYLQHSTGYSLNQGELSARAAPWQTQRQDQVSQLLLGGSWTTENQFSLILEAWWDGTAQSAAQWRAWSARNRALRAAITALPQYRRELSGQLLWQTRPLSAAANLQRRNLYARASWQSGAWQPALDILWTPQDGGRVLSAALGWQGDRLRIDGGLRRYGGPSGAVLAQLPDAGIAYVSATWAF